MSVVSRSAPSSDSSSSLSSLPDRLYPFFTIFVGILIACFFPFLGCSYCGAPLHPEISVWWGVIPGIFLIEGLTLPRNAMLGLLRPSSSNSKGGGKMLKAHIFVQVFNFGLMPIVVLGVHRFLKVEGWLPRGLDEGLLTFVAVPTTTSMCVMHTSVAGGNAPLAAFGAVLGNTLAVVVSPFWLSLFCDLGTPEGGGVVAATPGPTNGKIAAGEGGPGSTVDHASPPGTTTSSEGGVPVIDYSALLISFSGKMLLPLLVGQLLQPSVPSPWRRPIVKANQTLIACLLFQVFSDVVYHGGMLPVSLVLQIIMLVCALHVLFLWLAWTLAGCAGISDLSDRIACLFCATHKTVVLGVPLLHTVFGASRTPEQMVLLVFPLIAYHLFQLVFDLVLAQKTLRPLVTSTVAGEAKWSPISAGEQEGKVVAEAALLSS